MTYGRELVASLKADPLVGELAQRLTLYDTLTREPWPREGRQTDLMTSGKMFRDLGLPPIHPDTDRGMICGSIAMLNDTKVALESFGLVEGANNRPASFVVEKAFVG